MRALQGHSGGNRVDPTLQNYVEIPSELVDHIYHIGSAFNFKSIIEAGLIAGGNVEVKDDKRASSQQWTLWMNQKKIHHR